MLAMGVSVWLAVWLFAYICVSLLVFSYIYVCVCLLPVSAWVYLFVSTCLVVCIPMCWSILLLFIFFFFAFVCLSVCVCISVCLYVRGSTQKNVNVESSYVVNLNTMVHSAHSIWQFSACFQNVSCTSFSMAATWDGKRQYLGLDTLCFTLLRVHYVSLY